MRQTKEIWSGIALGQASDSRIAAELGVTPTAVAYQRKIRGIQRFQGSATEGYVYLNEERRSPRSAEEPDWVSVDWLESNAEIAFRLGVSLVAVAYMREHKDRLACEPIPTLEIIEREIVLARERLHRLRKIDWNAIDWTLSDDRLSKEIGVSRSIVEQYRTKFAQE